MTYIKRLILAPAFALSLVVGFAPLAYAQGDSIETSPSSSSTTVTSGGAVTTTTESHSGSGESSTTTKTGRGGSTVAMRSSDTTTTEAADTETANDTDKSENHMKGKQKIAELKKDHKEHSAEERKNFCNNHRNNFEARYTNLKSHAAKVQADISAVYDKGVAYKTANQLTVPGYAALVAAVDTDNSAVTTALSAVVVPKLDCTSPTVATDVATFKVSVDAVRDNLRTYRTDVRTLLKAIKTAAQASKTETQTTTGGTQ